MGDTTKVICKICGKEKHPTVGGICSEDCVNKLKKQDKKNFQNELHTLFLKYANDPFTLDFNDLKEAIIEGLNELALVW